MFPHGINGITIEHQLLMHRLSSRKHYILGYPIEKRAFSEKKVLKVKFRKCKVGEVTNIYLMVQPLAKRYYTASYTWITMVHHVTGKIFQLF